MPRHKPTLQLSQHARRVLVVLLPDVHLQDLAGPVQSLHEAAHLGGAYALAYCGPERQVRSAQGLLLSDLAPLPEPRGPDPQRGRPGDLVLVPGTWSQTLDRLRAPVAWLRAAHAAGATVASICSGAFALAQAGLLDGRRCTTHWKLTERLRKAAPRARVIEERLFVRDDGVITSAGIAAGIDLALAIIEQDHGPLVVARVARELVVYLRRSGDQAQRSVYLDHRTHLHPGVHRVQDFLVENPDSRASTEVLARLAGMSPRNLTRVFARATGVTPKQFASKVKLQVARDLLDDPQRTVESIAGSCGFEDARQLRRLWRQSFGTSIRAARLRFAEGNTV